MFDAPNISMKYVNKAPPAFNERKLKNMKNDCELIASKNNIEFKWIHRVSGQEHYSEG